MKLHRTGLAAFACALLLSACQQGGDTEGPENDTDDEDSVAPIPVETSIPVRGDIYAVYSGTAPIEAYAEGAVD